MALDPFIRTPIKHVVADSLPESFSCLLIDELLLEPPEPLEAATGTMTAPKGIDVDVEGAFSGLVIYPIDRRARSFRIGRSRSRGNEIVIRDRRISASHALLEPAPDLGFFLIDLKSSNGTYVNGAPVERALVKPGVTFVIARLPISLLGRDELLAILRQA